MSKVKIHNTDKERIVIELTAMETKKLFLVMNQIEYLSPAMDNLKDKLDLILDHVSIEDDLD